MRTRARWSTLVLLAAAVACGDQPTETVPERGGLAVPGSVALATASSGDGLSITTDRDDYAPGDTVWFTGAGWAGEDTLDIVLEDAPMTHEPHRWFVVTLADGTFRDSTYVVDVGDLGVRFALTATSRGTGRSLTVNFTDGNVRVFGVPSTVVFEVTIESFSNGTCGNAPSSTVLDTLGPSGSNGTNVGAFQNGESVRLTAAATSLAGGAFLSWNASTATNPYTPVNARTICVPGFQSGQRDYVANYTPVADIRIVKNGPSSVNVGANATYTLVVSNAGQLATTNAVSVSDALPSGFTFVSGGSVGSGWSCTNASPIVCTRSAAPTTLAAGASFPNLIIVATAPGIGSAGATNTATVSMAGDLNTTNNTSSVTTTVVGTPNLTIDKSHEDDFTRGATEQYTLDVANVGTGATTQTVTVRDTLPAGLTFQTGTGTGWTCSAASGVVTCTRPVANAIGAGETTSITLTVLVANGTPPANSITNRARVSGGGEAAVSTVTCTLATNCDADVTTVGDANHAPVAKDDDYSVNEDNALSKNAAEGVLANDTDADNNALSAILVSAPDVAKTESFTLNADGSFDFTPKANFHGTVTFTYKASDNIAESGVATVTITVVSVNDAPSFTKGADQEVLEDSGPKTATGWATAISAGPTDESGQQLTFTVTNDNNALFSAQPAINASSGTLTFTPAADAFGTAQVTATLKDNGGTDNGGVDEFAQTFTITVKPVNDAPSFTKGADKEVFEDAGLQTFTGWATGISAGPANESGQTLTFQVTNNTNTALFNGAIAVSSTGTLSFTPAANAFGEAEITIHLEDNGGTADGGVDRTASTTFKITVKPVNDVPSFKKGGDKTVNEGSGAASYTGWATDLSAGPANESTQTLDFIVTNDNNALFSVQPAVDASGKLTFTPAAGPNGTAVVTVKIHDNGGTADGGVDTSAPQTFNITVSNVAPSILTLTLPVAPVAVGTTVNLSATFSDPGTADAHTAVIDWEDGTSSGTVNESAQSVSGSHVYVAPGIYTVKLTVSDESESDSESFLYVVVYDPSAGFVTGGGWINSPTYACPTYCNGATGKANFGFVSKYLKGATVPTGNTEFQFHAGNINFSSTLYEWLVVQGSSKATYKGEGTINGSGRYAFLLSAIDNGNSGDRFRIKIWDKVTNAVVYDNQNAGDGLTDTADPTTMISGGNIVIHAKK